MSNVCFDEDGNSVKMSFRCGACCVSVVFDGACRCWDACVVEENDVWVFRAEDLGYEVSDGVVSAAVEL